jgi:hypothetical protein
VERAKHQRSRFALASLLLWNFADERATLNDGAAVVPCLNQNRCEVAIVDLHISPLHGISLI